MTNPTTPVEAVALVIRTAGWDAMAKEYVQWPHKREAIRRVIGKDLRKRFSAKIADDFERLAEAAR